MKLALDTFSRTPNYHLAHNCGLPNMPFTRAPGLPLGRLPGQLGTIAAAYYVPLAQPRGALLHLWNKVPLVGHTPWGVTFESRFPRLPDGSGAAKATRARIAEDGSCVFVNALSQYAHARMFSALTPDEQNALAGKSSVVYPAIRTHITRTIARVDDEDDLQLLFVGHDFFRKGGEAVLRFIESSAERFSLRATFVSSLRYPDYAAPWVSSAHQKNVMARLAKNPRIRWHQSLTHPEIMAIAASSDVALLPTLADTFGYALAEGAVSGALPVGTAVQAIPEIVGKHGGVIPIPIDEHREWTGTGGSAAEYFETLSLIEEGLTALIERARNDPDWLRTAREGARREAVEKFGRDRDRALALVYRSAGVDAPEPDGTGSPVHNER